MLRISDNKKEFIDFNLIYTKEYFNKNTNLLLLIFVGIFIGFINGFCGGGGGMIVVPILNTVFKLPDKVSHATTIFIILPLCVCSFLVYALKKSIEMDIALIIGAGFVLGGVVGAFLLKKISNKFLKLIFAVIILASGIRLII